LHDVDDDNDGLTDPEEAEMGTNPKLVDTDGDGYNDLEDEYPLDPDKWRKEDEIDGIPILAYLIPIIIIIIVLIFIFVLFKWTKPARGMPPPQYPQQYYPQQPPQPQYPQQPQMAFNYCRNCGKKIPPDSNICPYCGNKKN
ncbi:MAG: zinc ribbon domain-containing protein, partial [Thermoplasmata archaeon]